MALMRIALGMLAGTMDQTGSTGEFPLSTAATSSSARKPISLRVSMVALPMCGVTKTGSTRFSRMLLKDSENG